MDGYSVHRISIDEARPWLLSKHYARRVPSITDSFGLYEDKELVGVITYGIPPSNNLCEGICGPEFKTLVRELNRVCLLNDKKNECSYFIGQTFKMLASPLILVSYSDTGQGHIGYTYQATNWIYTGLSAKRTDADIDIGNKHSRHQFVGGQIQKQRPRKHRYLYFLGDKRVKRNLKSNLRYPVLPYPKGESQTYDSGQALSTQLMLL